MKNILLITILVLLTSCADTGRISKLDASTGTFQTPVKATTITSKKVDLDLYKSILLISEDGQDFYDGFNKNTVTNIGYFNNVFDSSELETFIIKNNLVNEVPALKDRIGMHNLAKSYKPFLWLSYNIRRTQDRKFYLQLVLTNTLTFEDFFIAETQMNNFWVGVNVKENWYPLYNALIQYIRDNSSTYK